MCERYSDDRVLDILLGRVDEEERTRFEAHLAECEACRRAREELARVAQLAAGARTITPSAEADAAVRGYITSHVPGRPARTQRAMSAGHPFAWMTWAGAACAAAAAVIFAIALGTRGHRTQRRAPSVATTHETPAPVREPAAGPRPEVDAATGDERLAVGDLAPAPEGGPGDPSEVVVSRTDEPVAPGAVGATDPVGPTVARPTVPSGHDQPYDHDAERRFTCAFAKVDGTIKFKRSGSDNWMTAVARVPLLQGDEIDARFGAARIDVDGGSAVYVNRNTRFTVAERAPDARRLVLAMASGDVYVSEAGGTFLNVRTPHGTVRPVGTRYAVMCRTSMTSVLVRDGAVVVSGAKDDAANPAVHVATGHLSVLRPGRAPSRPVAVNVSASLSWLRSVKRGLGPRKVKPATLAFQYGVSPSPRYAATTDTYLVERHPSRSYGRIDFAVADGPIRGKPEDKSMRALLKWDVTGIPADSVVVSASITLAARERIIGRYDAFAMGREWFESASSWDGPKPGTRWESPGAMGPSDVGPLLATSPKTDQRECVFEFNAAGIAILQRWVDAPSTNLGVLIADRRNSWPLTFDTRECKAAARRPVLTVTFLPIEGMPGDAE